MPFNDVVRFLMSSPSRLAGSEGFAGDLGNVRKTVECAAALADICDFLQRLPHRRIAVDGADDEAAIGFDMLRIVAPIKAGPFDDLACPGFRSLLAIGDRNYAVAFKKHPRQRCMFTLWL